TDGTPARLPLSLNMHTGNAFTVRFIPRPKSMGKMHELEEHLNYIKTRGVPNFYGVQRFGDRGVNHIVGKALVLRMPELAAKVWLTDFCYESEVGSFNRKNWGDWEKCAIHASIDGGWQAETFFSTLAKNRGDFLGAFGTVPLGRFFVRSYASYIFNTALSELVHRKTDLSDAVLPMVGYGTSIRSMPATYKKVLLEERVHPKMFKFDDCESISNYGSQRDAMVRPKHTGLSRCGPKKWNLSFSLGCGSFATVVLRFLFDYRWNSLRV
ncbi:MAG: tRNA pseudouridine(13) synthase TruD, partial [Rhabdochlamydiaceae bacterium]